MNLQLGKNYFAILSTKKTDYLILECLKLFFGGAEEAENDTLITRAQFIDRIMEELRDGNKNVCIYSTILLFIAIFLGYILGYTYFAGGHFFKECFPSFGKSGILFVVASAMVFGYYFSTADPEIRISQNLLRIPV